jgi:intracellular multiplication protein IcmO
MASEREVRGVQQTNEIDSKTRYVDVRSWKDKFVEELSEPKPFLMWVWGPLVLAFVFPALLEIGIGVSLFMLMWGCDLQEKASLPFKMPKSAGLIDPHEISPRDDKPTDGDGIGYFGIERSSRKELWFTNSDLRTHILMMGSTGSGKTEALLSLSFNALAWGSGFVYVDGKGTTELYTKIFAMARHMGREDDLLVINYMKGNKDLFGPQETKLSNTMNPFTTGSAGSLTELVVSLMDDSGGDGMWKGRAMALIAAIMQALIYMRDQKEILLDVEIIRDYLLLDKITALSKRRDLPVHVLKAIKGYLVSIPGYVEGSSKQSDTTLEQHGYLQMQFTKVLSTLADAYAHIFKTNLGEVNFWDVVVNRRILVVLLPALEFSEPELANLGKIIIACLRAMMATGLGNLLEGTIQEVVEVNPTKGNTPFITILDEYGYYAVKGSAVMPAQARGLGFCMCFAGQDYPSFKKASPEEAAAIAANCNIKICLKLEDPQETFELFKAAAGQSYVTVKSGYDTADGGGPLDGGKKYKSMKNVNIDMRDRIDLRDLQTQRPGEAHIFFAGHIVRATFFYANPPKAPKIRVNYFLRVEPPEKQDLLDIQSGVKELMEKLLDPKFQREVQEAVMPSMELQQLRGWFDAHKNRSLTEQAIAALAEYKLVNKQQTSALTAMLDEPPQPTDVDAFSEDYDADPEEDSFLEAEEVKRQVMAVETIGGAPMHVAEERAHDVVQDMKVATSYGVNDAPEEINFEHLVDVISDIEEIISEE